MPSRARIAAFTLVELAIVLVLIGLIVGGVYAGRELIHQSNLRSVITDKDRYLTAITVFREKYGMLPGDFTNTARFFPCIPDPLSASNYCYGNGDSVIGPWSREGLRAWQHLSQAGLVAGNYTGIGYLVQSGHRIGVNVPGSKISNAGGFSFITQGSTAYGTNARRNSITLGAIQSGAGTSMSGPMINGLDAYTIDSKTDDGLADRGNVITMHGTGWDKTTPNTCLDGNYNTDTAASYVMDSEAGCIMKFLDQHTIALLGISNLS